MFKDLLVMTFKQIKKRPLRTFLTALQITLGIAMVAVVLNLIFNLNFTISQIGQSSDDIYTFQVGAEVTTPDGQNTYYQSRSILTESDMKAIKGEVDTIQYASPFERGWNSLADVDGTYYQLNQVAYSNHQLAKILDLDIIRGMFFSEEDFRQGARVAVIGEIAANQLFPGQDPIGQEIKFYRHYSPGYLPEALELTIIGVYEQGNIRDAYMDYKASPLIVPLTVESSRGMMGGSATMNSTSVSETTIVEATEITETIEENDIVVEELSAEGVENFDNTSIISEENIIETDIIESIDNNVEYYYDVMPEEQERIFHEFIIRIEDGQYNSTKIALDAYIQGNISDGEEAVLRKQGEFYGNIGDEMRPLLIILSIFGALMVVISSIGILTTMLVNILERTKQVGIEKALGASKGLIFLKFNIEAVLVALFGGIMGLILATYLSSYIADIYQTFPVEISTGLHPLAILVSLLVAICAGWLFGMYPSLQAAKLDSTDALRNN
ncbi:ABC transporter permease [Natronospora cellulosivora (SeqCode)]